MLTIGRLSRRSLVLGGMFLVIGGARPSAGQVAPINVNVTTKDLGTQVQVGIRVSVHVNTVHFDNFSLGTVNVPKGGKRVIEVLNPVGAIVNAIIAIHGVVVTVTVTAKFAGSVIASQTVRKPI